MSVRLCRSGAGSGTDLHVPDIERFGVPVTLRLELCTVVGLQDEDTEREPSSNLVQEPDCRALVTGIVDLHLPDAGAVVNGRELVEPFGGARDALEELHVHRQAVARLGLLVALPAFTVRRMLLIGR